jgi:hypothetical protein
MVADGDNTLYFESTRGTVVVSSTAGVQVSKCDVNSDGTVDNADFSLALNVALGNGPACAAAFDINQDGACNVIDVQRVANAALGLGCRVGP